MSADGVIAGLELLTNILKGIKKLRSLRNKSKPTPNPITNK